jgi:hypothetical protein
MSEPRLGGRRWVELLDPTDSVTVLDDNGVAVCRVACTSPNEMTFEFLRGVTVVPTATGVLIRPLTDTR